MTPRLPRRMIASFAACLSLGLSIGGTATAAPAALAGSGRAVASTYSTQNVLRQGQSILTGNNMMPCSLTLLEGGEAYTARHCSMNVWQVGSPVLTLDRRVIGRVAAMKPGFDVVRIDLNPSYRVAGAGAKRDYDTVQPGEPVNVMGLDRTYPTSYATRYPLTEWDAHPAAVASIGPDNAVRGTSGGPVVDSNGDVLGVNVGATDINVTAEQPYPRVGLYIPWHVIEAELGGPR